MDLEIVYLSPDELTPYEGNTRRHNPEDIDQAHSRTNSHSIEENIMNDTLSEQELYDMLKAAFVNVRENCADDAVYYVTSPQGGSLGLMMMMMMRDAGLEVRHVLMWRKTARPSLLGGWITITSMSRSSILGRRATTISGAANTARPSGITISRASAICTRR